MLRSESHSNADDSDDDSDDGRPLLNPSARGSSVVEMTVEEVLDHCIGRTWIGLGWFQWRLLVFATLMNTSVMSLCILFTFALHDIARSLSLDIHKNSMELSLVDSLVYFGWLVGATGWGLACDRYGRRKTFILTLSLLAISGFATMLANGVVVLGFTRFMTGTSIGGCEAVAFIIVTEYCSLKQQGLANFVFQCGSAAGICFLAISGSILLHDDTYLGFTNWRVLTGICTAPVTVLLAFFAYFPETPQFLLGQGKPKQARETLDYYASVNKSNPLPNNVVIVQSASPDALELPSANHSIWGPGFAKKTFTCWLLWGACGLLYYGMTEQAGEVGISGLNHYWSMAFSGLIETPSYLACFLAMKRFGVRATVLNNLWSIAFFSLLLMLPLPSFILVIIALISKMFAASVFSAAYVWTANLYPSNLQGRAFGSCSSAARGGSMLAPVIVIAVGEIDELMPTIVFGILSTVVALTIAKLSSPPPPPPNDKGRDDAVELVEMTKTAEV